MAADGTEHGGVTAVDRFASAKATRPSDAENAISTCALHATSVLDQQIVFSVFRNEPRFTEQLRLPENRFKRRHIRNIAARCGVEDTEILLIHDSVMLPQCCLWLDGWLPANGS